MQRFPKLLIVSLFLASPVWAQQADEHLDETAGPDGTEEPPVEAEEIDEEGLDDQGFTDEDDDFLPSEDIPADQSIPFPADI